MDSMDLDVDMDVDFVADEPIPAQPQDTPSPGEVVEQSTEDQSNDSRTLVPNKIHIQGLDVLNPEQVKAYVAEHFPDSSFEKIEWIDDSSANLVFATESAAQDALVALSLNQIGDVTQLPPAELLPAKSFSQVGDVSLQVRFAVVADKKQRGAAQRSRFYLLNPEYDPENRETRRRYRDRDDYRQRPGRRSREDEPRDHFDVNLYDDNAEALASRDERPSRRRSHTPEYSSDRERRSSRRNANRGKELFGDESGGRDRSASPGRDRRRGVDVDRDEAYSDGSAARNRRRAGAVKERLRRNNQTKELFSGDSSSGRLEDPDSTSTYLSERFSLPLYDGSADSPQPPKKLEDRIRAPGSGPRLADRITNPNDAAGFNIRGAAKQTGVDQGFAIKGASKSAKELFPEKLGGSNAGKELFSESMERRPRRRQKAGDLFD